MRLSNQGVTTRITAAGLTLLHTPAPRSAVGYVGVAVRVGARDEAANDFGLAHFVEHTIFKGTVRRRAWHIINRREAVGGELNAYTTKEETVIYSAFPGNNPRRAAELIADLVANSQFPAAELDKEREVVADEIDSYLDTPSEAVYDDFEDLMFAGSSLGHNILGTRQALEGFDSDHCRRYLHRWYVPQNMVVFYAGSMSAERVFAILEQAFAQVDGAAPQRPAQYVPEYRPFEVHKSIDSHQAHTIMGARVGAIGNPDGDATALLTNILGGPGMNSLLNVSLREHRGLVYNVEASTGIFSDCGALAIYYGCAPDDNLRCAELVRRTIEDVANGLISPRRLEMAKKQYLGQIMVANENLENRVLGNARAQLLLGRVRTTRQALDRIQAITAADIARLAASLLPLSRLTLGPQ